jgi:hypothetical protein
MNNIRLLIIIGGFLLLFIPYVLLMPRQTAFELLDVICVALAVGGASSYAQEAWEAIRLPIHRVLASHYIVIGVLLTAVEMALLFGGMWYWRISGQPIDVINSSPILFTRWLAVVALGLFMVTSYSQAGMIAIRINRSPTMVASLALAIILGIWWLLS